MKVLGIDCSTNSLAFAVYEDGTLTSWGEVGFGKGDALHRMNRANRVVISLMKQPQFQNVDLVAFEGATYVQNHKTAIFLAMAFGAALSPFIRPGIDAMEVPPITWQQYIGNRAFTKAEKDELKKQYPDHSDNWRKEKMREIRKQRTLTWAKDKFGVDIQSDNISDAIGVGWYGLNNYEGDKK